MASTPTYKTLTATPEGLAQYDHFTRNYIIDRPIVTIASCWGPDLANGTGLTLLGTGPATSTQVASSGLASINFGATARTQVVGWRVPQNLDFTKDIEFRVLWSNSAAATAAQTCAWSFAYIKLINGVTTLAVPATTTGITNPAAQISFGANIPGYSGWATLAGGTITTMTPGDDHLNLLLTETLVTLTTVDLYEVQARYYAKYVCNTF